MEFKNNPSESAVITVDTNDDDVVWLISSSLSKLLEAADRIGQNFGMFPGEANRLLHDNLGKGHYEIRPEGNYGMWLKQQRDGSYLLNIDNRNSRGHKPMAERLHEVVNSALKRDSDS